MKSATLSPGLSVRTLTPEDAVEYWTLRLMGLQESPAAFGSSYEESKDSPAAEQAKRLAFAPGEGLVVGVFSDHLVGLGGLSRCERLKERHKAWIWGLYVLPDFRQRGAGRAIMVQLLDYARVNPTIVMINLTVTTTNLAAKRLYEDLGFSTIGHEPKALQVGGAYYDWNHMSMECHPVSSDT